MTGRRFAELPLADMTQEQLAIAERALSGPRGKYDGSLVIWLRSPTVADHVERLGEYLRFESPVPLRLKELAIMVVARHKNAAYPWSLHYGQAVRAGVAAETLDAIAKRQRPDSMPADEAAVHDFCTALLSGQDVADSVHVAALAALGERGEIDLIGLIGYYQMVCMIKTIDRVPPVAGKAPDLPD